MSSSEPVILFENVAVRYRLPREQVSGIKEYTIRRLQRRLTYEDFWALKDISFQVNRGEIFGVIGRNGSGKSTMLKVIARVLSPSRGRVVIRGKVAPLLELGAGFHPELTGRENVHLNSALLGRSRREIDQLLPGIIEFSEISDFIDAPIRTYSTGMVARLGFAVATASRPEVLLVDEVLSVGDSEFQQKCLDRMYAFQEQGTTIVLVSHSMAAIESFCSRALWLQEGQLQVLGDATEVAHHYIRAGAPVDISDAAQTPGSLKPVPESQPIPGDQASYVRLPALEHMYPATPYFNAQQGAVSVWLKFCIDQPQHTAILFHSDDSRFVLYTNIDLSDPRQPRRQIVARAGGNRRVLETHYGRANFPEVLIDLDDPDSEGPAYPYDEWHLVTMTWDGFPEGEAHLFLDDTQIGEFSYTPRHNNQYRLPQQISVGIRPPEWVGEIIQREDNTVVDLRPTATLAVSASGQKISDMRLHQHPLSAAAIQKLLGVRPQNSD